MISREEAIEYFVYCLIELKMDREAIREAYEMAIEALSHERPKGQWNPISADRVRCTNCDAIRDITTQLFWDSCPNCGADMRISGEQDV